MKVLLDIHGFQRLNSDIFWFLPEFHSDNNRRSKVGLMKYFNMFDVMVPNLLLTFKVPIGTFAN